MKRCPECRRDYYDDSLLYCLDDGSALLAGPATDGRDGAATAILGGHPVSSDRASQKKTQIFDAGGMVSGEVVRHKLAATAVIAVFAVMLGGFGYGLYRFLERPPAPARPRTANVETRRLTGDGKTDQAAISPDGKALAYVRTDGERSSLWLKQILTDSSLPVQTSEELVNFLNLVFSPDGNFLYFNGISRVSGPPTIYRIPTFGGAAAKVLTNAWQISFAADGKKIAFSRNEGDSSHSIYIADSDGSNERKIGTRSGKRFFNSPPSFSPDGRYLAVSAGDDDLLPAPDEGIVLISTADGSEKELGSQKWGTVTSLSWHPTGDSIIAAASDYDTLPGQLWEISYPNGDSRRLTNNLNGYTGVSITADGNAVVTMERYSRTAIWVSPDLDPAKAKPIMPSTGDTWGFSWTPDGRIVYVSDQSGDAEVWSMNADGTDARQITRDRLFKGFPDVSSDGRVVVYASSEGAGRLKKVDVNGGEPTVIAASGAGLDNPDISPDDKWVLYSAWVDGRPRILRTPLAGGETTVLTNVDSTEPRYSPDGSQFACFVLNAVTQNWDHLAIYPAEGGEPIKHFEVPAGTAASRGPLWTPDGKAITIHIAKGQRIDLWALPVDGGPPKQLTDFEVQYVARRDYSRDGKRIALVRGENIRNAVMITGFR